MNRLLSTLAATLLVIGSGARAQAAGVDLVLSHASVRLGAPCSPFQWAPYFPWISAGQTWLFEVYSRPNTTHMLVFGPPPTSSTSIPGIENLLFVHAPLSIPIVGVTGPLDSASACGQGRSTYLVTVPGGPSSGFDFAIQVLSISSTTGNWAFSNHHWLTYL